MKKFLFISNSFGVDSTRYLYGISRAAGKDIKVMTLYIGGCSLYRHYRNMLSEERAYEVYYNGMGTGLRISLKEALLADEWDVVATQQSSPRSGEADSYFPYVTELAAYIRKMAIDGYVVKLEVPELKEMTRLLSSCSNNLNQIAKRVNATGNIYSTDFDEIREHQENLWNVAEKIMRSLSKLK